ncbi:MAG: hypothetical protein ACEQSH_00210 [Bacteroidia bacterium]
MAFVFGAAPFVALALFARFTRRVKALCVAYLVGGAWLLFLVGRL